MRVGAALAAALVAAVPLLRSEKKASRAFSFEEAGSLVVVPRLEVPVAPGAQAATVEAPPPQDPEPHGTPSWEKSRATLTAERDAALNALSDR